MGVAFPLLATVTWLAAVGAVAFRKPVHAALSLVASLLGLAVVFLKLDAEFLGFAQILVYVGAVAVLMVFVIQFTRNDGMTVSGLMVRPTILGWGVAVLVTGGLMACVLGTPGWDTVATGVEVAGMQEIGESLMGEHVVALEAIGLLLTVALMGALLIGMRGRSGEGEEA